MTVAEAIAQVHCGGQDGLRSLLSITAPNLWIAVSMLCSTAIGTRMTEIYSAASQTTAALHSPSELRLWLCRTAYPMILQQPDEPLRQNGLSMAESYRSCRGRSGLWCCCSAVKALARRRRQWFWILRK